MTGVIDKLVVYPENMRKNLDRLGGLIHSQRVLLALTQKGVSREDAYAMVQRNAMRVWREDGDFLALLKADKEVGTVLSARARSVVRPRLSPESGGHDLQAGVRRLMRPPNAAPSGEATSTVPGNKAGHARLHHRVAPDVRRDAMANLPHGVFRQGRNVKLLPDTGSRARGD